MKKPVTRHKTALSGKTGSPVNPKTGRSRLKKNSNMLYRAMLDNAGDAILLADADGHIVEANLKAEELFGYAKEELIGMHYTALHPEDQLERTVEAFGLGDISLNNAVVVRKDGSNVHVDIKNSIIDVAGDRMVQGIFRDISLYKWVEERLLLEQERLKSLLMASPAAIFSYRMSDDFDITFISEGIKALTGYDAGEFTADAQFMKAHIHPEDVVSFPVIKAHLLKDGHFGHEYRFLRKDGTYRWLFDEMNLLYDAKNNPLEIIGLCMDIHARKQAEEQLRHYRDHLENTVNRQTSELQKSVVLLNNEIAERKQVEEKAKRAYTLAQLGQLSAGIAHEINNPNNFILLNAELLRDLWSDIQPVLSNYSIEKGIQFIKAISISDLDNDISRLLSDIIDGSCRIKNIVDNLKGYSGRKDAPDHNEYIDINHTIEKAVVILGSHIKKLTTRFKTELQRPLPPVKGSSHKLEQVIINLLVNSLQALPDNKYGVTISTFFKSAPRSVTVLIEDEGSGMDEETAARIFEPFFTTKQNNGGIGLGLTISNDIVKEHLGTLEFKSAPGKGTSAIIRLPASDWSEAPGYDGKMP